MPRLRLLIALVAATAVLAGTGVFSASAGPLDPPESTTTTSGEVTPSSSSTTTTTTGDATTSTTMRPGGIMQVTTSTAAPTTTTTTGPTTGTSGQSGTTTSTIAGSAEGTTGPRVVPPDAQAIINSFTRSKANSSAKLLAALQPLIDMGVSPEQTYQMGMGRFPAAGLANFVDDWYFPRFDGSFHFHKGTDIFAPMGTPVRAPADGVLRQDNDRLGGTVVYVKEKDGTYYYMAHLSAWVEGQTSGMEVKTGDIVGFVGNSGDAQGGATHIHFQVHPNGGEPVNPKPYLDQWLADALASAPSLVASVRAAKMPGSITGSVALRLPDSSAANFDAPAVPAESQLLWASSASPQGGSLQLAEAAATQAARTVDWDAEARRQAERVAAWQQAVATARIASLGLAPVALRPLLG